MILPHIVEVISVQVFLRERKVNEEALGNVYNYINISNPRNIDYCHCHYYLVLSHLQHPGSLIVPGLVPQLYEDVGVEGHHDHQRDHKDDQEDCSEVGFLDIFGPSSEVAGTLLPRVLHPEVSHALDRDLEDEEARSGGDEGGDPGSDDQSEIST